MKREPSCPSNEILLGLLRGSEKDSDSQTTGPHVLNCPECQSRVEGMLTQEPSLAELRAAHAAGGTTATRTLIEKVVRRAMPVKKANAELSFLAPPSPDFPDDLGMLDRYRIVELLGKGGMGIVFRAVDPTLARTVALKVIIPKYAAREKIRIRFLEEARSTVAVRSAHVAEVYDANVWNDVPYLTMELLTGVSLDKRPKPMPVDAWRRIGFGIAKGLADAHRIGMIHRDLKPGNVHLGTDARTGKPTVKIIDFGLARSSDRAVELTNAGEILGTPAYMSPEQAAGKKVDHRTDLYALGVILYQLATGKLPYLGAGQGVYAIITELASPEPLPSVRGLAPALPASLVALIDRLLAKNPDDRPASADEVLELFRASLKDDAGVPPATDVVASAAYLSVGAMESTPYQSVPESVRETLPYNPPASSLETRPFEDLSTEVPIQTVATPTLAEPPRARPTWVLPAVCIGILLGGLLIGFAMGAFGKKDEPQAKLPATDLPKGDGPKKADPVPPVVNVTVKLTIELAALPANADVYINDEKAEVERVGNNGGRAVITTRVLPEYVLVIRRGTQTIRKARLTVPPERVRAGNFVVQNDDVRFEPIEVRPIRSNIFVIHGGVWERTANELFLAATDNRSAQKIVFGAPSWTDYVYGVEFYRARSATTGFEVHFRCADASEEYILRFAPPGVAECYLLALSSDGKLRQLTKANYKIDEEKWYALAVRATGSRLECSIADDRGNTQTLIDIENASIPAGAVGLSARKTGYRFRNVKVSAPDGTALWDGLPDDDADVKRVASLPAHLVPITNVPVEPEVDLSKDWIIETASVAPTWAGRGNVIEGTNLNTISRRSYLLSKKDYGDYRLKFEYRLDAANTVGGIAIRATPDEQLPEAPNVRLRDHPIIRLSPALRVDDPTGTAHYLTNQMKLLPKLSARSLDSAWRPAELVVRGETCTFTVDGRLIAEYQLDAKTIPRPFYLAALARKSGRVGFQINSGKMSIQKVSIEELPKLSVPVAPVAVVEPPPPVSPIPRVPYTGPDPFKADTTWRGVKIVHGGQNAGQTSFYELSIESRNGDRIKGTVVENGLIQRTLDVKGGTVKDNAVAWNEVDPQNPTKATKVSGTYADGMLTLDIDDGGVVSNVVGKAKLFRSRVAAARDAFDEFYPIFNGRNLDVWWNTDNVNTYGWKVTKQGTLVGSGDKVGHLYSKHAFGDVHLWCRVRINDGGRGGVFVRGNYGPAGTDEAEGYLARIASGVPNEPAGSLKVWEKFEASKQPRAVKPNQWFDLEMFTRGNEVEVRINGLESVKFKDIVPRPPTGRIVLQQFDAKSTVEFAMIAIKELKPK